MAKQKRTEVMWLGAIQGGWYRYNHYVNRMIERGEVVVGRDYQRFCGKVVMTVEAFERLAPSMDPNHRLDYSHALELAVSIGGKLGDYRSTEDYAASLGVGERALSARLQRGTMPNVDVAEFRTRTGALVFRIVRGKEGVDA